MQIKNYKIELRHRENGELDQVYETIQTTSLAKARALGKAIAESRGWTFHGCREIKAEVPHATA